MTKAPNPLGATIFSPITRGPREHVEFRIAQLVHSLLWTVDYRPSAIDYRPSNWYTSLDMQKIDLSKLNTRFIKYTAILIAIVWILSGVLFKEQNTIMFKYFIEKPPIYFVRTESMARLMCLDFQKNLSSPSLENIRVLLDKYNSPPSLNVDFIYSDRSGTPRSLLKDIPEKNLTKAEYVYPVKYGNLSGKLLVYDMNTQFKKKFEEYRRIAGLTRVLFLMIMVLLFLMLLFREYTAGIEKQKKIVESQRRNAEHRAAHDGATGLCNQKYFKMRLEDEMLLSQKYHRPITLIMCDIDHFKEFNDTYGHIAGDKILKMIADTIRDNVRGYDVAARYGGEEFAVLFIGNEPDETIDAAMRHKTLTDKTIEIAGRIKKKIEETTLAVGDKTAHVTISMGVSSYTGKDPYTGAHFIGEADQALYTSKNRGRNRITLFDPATKESKTYE